MSQPRTVRSYQNLHNRSLLFGEGNSSGYSSDTTTTTSGRFSPSITTANGRSFSPARLFGTPEPTLPFTNTNKYMTRVEDEDLEYMESQSDERISGLASKVNLLKNITGKIGEEIRSGNNLIDSMNHQFRNTGNILQTTMRKFNIMASKEGGLYMCYMVFFIVFVVMFCYWMFFR